MVFQLERARVRRWFEGEVLDVQLYPSVSSVLAARA